MKKAIKLIILVFIISLGVWLIKDYGKSKWFRYEIKKRLNWLDFKEKIAIPELTLDSDVDLDGIYDLDDIIDGARKDSVNKPVYKSAYYSGGYPPEGEGVCTDVVWRAFENAGYNLKDMIDKDIRENVGDYPRVGGNPDPNIDFRRVKNLVVFFTKYAEILTNEIRPRDIENLSQWQGGDIVVFSGKSDHIAIISDTRDNNGVPFIIHNAGPYTKEENALLIWNEEISKVKYHFRWPKVR